MNLDDLTGQRMAFRIVATIRQTESLQGPSINEIENLLFLRPELAFLEITPDGSSCPPCGSEQYLSK